MEMPIYKDESAWRAHMLYWQITASHQRHEFGLVAVGLFLLYLASGHWPVATFIVAAVWFIGLVALSIKDARSRKRLLEAIHSDFDLTV